MQKFLIFVFSLIIVPIHFTWYEGVILLDRDPSTLRAAEGIITLPFNLLLMLIVLIFSSSGLNTFFKAIPRVSFLLLFGYFIFSLLNLPLRISVLLFEIIYLILCINFFENFLSDIYKRRIFENYLYLWTVLLFIITLFSAYTIGNGFFLTKSIFIYNYEQYFTSILSLLISAMLFHILGFSGLIIGIFSGVLLYLISDSRLAIALTVFLPLYFMTYKLNLSYKIHALVFSLGVLSLYILYILNYGVIFDPDREFQLRYFYERLEFDSVFLPILSEEILTRYSFHNQFIDLYRVLGLSFFLLFIYLFKFLKKNIYGALAFAMIFLAGNVVNMMLHLYAIPLLAIFLVLGKYSKDFKETSVKKIS